jgi:hypothetical protein
MKTCCAVLIQVVSLFSCSPSVEQQKENSENRIETMEDELPVIDLDQIRDEPIELGLSKMVVVGGLEIVLLETDRDHLVNYPLRILFNDHFLLVGTATSGMNPGRMYRYDRDGKFIKEIGKGGKGPGEHIGGSPSKIRFYPEDSLIMVIWDIRGEAPQLFDLEGNFKGEVIMPFRGLNSVERWSDSLWFATGQDVWGPLRTPMDSIKLIFFSKEGITAQKILRTNYPALNVRQRLSFLRIAKPYNYQGVWKFNMKGDDTLYRIVNRDLKPDVVFATQTTEFPANVSILAESEGFWLLKQIKESIAGVNGKMIQGDFKQSFIIGDKPKRKATSVKFVDDVFFLFDQLELYDGNFIEKRLRWEDDRLYFAVPADVWVNELKSKLNPSKLQPEILEKLEILEGLKEDDNPVIFSFPLQSQINF